LWTPLLVCLPLAVMAAGATAVQAARSACRAPFATARRARLKLRAITALLHVIQPVARLRGRLSHGLTPWRRQVPRSLALPLPRTISIWSEQWQAAEERLKAIETLLRESPISLRRGGPYDRWDLEIRGGFFACAHTRMAIEEYPGGRQYLRFRAWPAFCMSASAVAAIPAVLAAWAAMYHSPFVAATLASLTALLMLRALGDSSAAMACLSAAFGRYAQAVQGAPSPAATTPAVREADDHPVAAHPDTVLPELAVCADILPVVSRRSHAQPGENSTRPREVDTDSSKGVKARSNLPLATETRSS
jgi:hypothetical protein